jgi:Glycosyl hydrolases family 2, TIM barrel domain/Glycosyl hydrolases family 2, sugar binding domain/Glycosyl hydrolases family 2
MCSQPPTMRRLPILLLLALVAVLAASAGPASAADTPRRGALYHDGPTGRFLLDGSWQLTQGGSRRNVAVPNAWNATGDTLKDFLATVATYRKTFRLPDAGLRRDWVVRFESVNYRATVRLNGHRLGAHTGAFTPFEFVLPARWLRRGVNTLEVRVDARHRSSEDFPFAGIGSDNEPSAGWWPYAGILREVYLREVDRVDLDQVSVLPDLRSPHSDVSVGFRVRAHNLSPQAQRATVTARFGRRRHTLGTAVVGAGSTASLTGRLTVRHPRLWEPDAPTLYPVTVDARVGGRVVQRWSLKTGVRSLRVNSQGVTLLNGKPLNARGFALHEDSPGDGGAQTNAERDQQLAWIREAGGTLLRSHYPLHPHVYEEADRLGLLVWDEVPVYQVSTPDLSKDSVRKLADQYLHDNVVANANHPSIIVWSVANELNAKVGTAQTRFIRHSVSLVRRLDDTRLIGQAFAGYPSSGCQKGYGPLTALGVNLYFGWYSGRLGEISDRTLLSSYMDQVHRCYPHKALFATEWGAEANREGPADEKGTYAFQAQWVRDTLGVFDTKPWLAGATYWTLQEFRIRPDWDGSNPYPTSPLHQKAVIAYDGTKKPAFDVLAQMYKAHRQLGG